jgi:tetratricopeptide (TPR) repeat protein
MKKVVFSVLIVVALCGVALAQYGAPSQQPATPGVSPQTNPSQGQQPGQPPAGQQQAPPSASQPGAGPQQGAQQPAAPAGPQPKSKEEYDAFVALQNEVDPAKAEEATHQFEQKFPDSQLKGMAYQQLMAKYQRANNADKTIEAGRKALEYDPNAAIALITVASVIAERTRDTDLDAQEKFTEGKKNAERAIQLIDSKQWAPSQITPQQLDVVKSMAYVAIGAMELNQKNDAGAEQALRKAIELNQIQPDAVTFLRLALVLDRQKKYNDALVAANRAVDLSGNEPAVREKAVQEQSRLKQLTGAGTGAAANPAPGGAAGATTTPAAKPATPPAKPQPQTPR